MWRSKKGKIMLPSKCVVCHSKKSKFIKRQKANGCFEDLGTIFDASGQIIDKILSDKPTSSLVKYKNLK